MRPYKRSWAPKPQKLASAAVKLNKVTSMKMFHCTSAHIHVVGTQDNSIYVATVVYIVP